jgi:hypothetical protein
MRPEDRRSFLCTIGGIFCCRPLSHLAAAPPRWQYQEGFGGLQVMADFVPQQLECFQQLGQLREDLRRALELRLPDTPVRVLLFHDRAAMRAYVRRKLPSAPDRRALFVHQSQRSTIYASRGPSLEEDLRHEFIHALLHGTFRTLPLWLDEGLAEYFEVPPSRRASRKDYLEAVQQQLARGEPIPLSSLEQIRQVDQMQLPHYRQAWAWVHFLLHGCPAAHDELVCFLGDLGSGIPAGQLGRRLNQRVGRLQRRFRDHFSSWS